jgi:ATP-dependent Clp protease adaptor protein ClpS
VWRSKYKWAARPGAAKTYAPVLPAYSLKFAERTLPSLPLNFWTMASSYQPLQEEDILLETAVIPQNRLVLHNDEVNTFEWVIETLVDVCKHNIEQAEQCAYIIHYRGKYAVKHGSLKYLKPMKDAITDRGINATIE